MVMMTIASSFGRITAAIHEKHVCFHHAISQHIGVGHERSLEEVIRNRCLFVPACIAIIAPCTIVSPQPPCSGRMGVRWNWHLVLTSLLDHHSRMQSIPTEYSTL